MSSYNRRKRGYDDGKHDFVQCKKEPWWHKEESTYLSDGGGGGGGGFRSKKRRTNETIEIEDRLESLILRVGEKSTSSLESNLEGLAAVLEADLSTYKTKILNIIVDCALKLPDKCTIYTTLIGLLNCKNYNFGGEVTQVVS
jgi:hypothetical protein